MRAAIEHEAITVAPDLYAAEVADALWKYVGAGQLAIRTAVASLEDAIQLVTRFVPGEEIVVEALHEAAGLSHPVDDLLYLVAARREAATLVTCDQRLPELCASAGVTVAGT